MILSDRESEPYQSKLQEMRRESRISEWTKHLLGRLQQGRYIYIALPIYIEDFQYILRLHLLAWQ